MTRRYYTKAELDTLTDEQVEDLAIAERVRERLANDNGVRYSMDEVIQMFGLARDDLEAEIAAERVALLNDLDPKYLAVPVEMVDVVDEDDNVIGAKRRDELDDTADRWRIISVWVTNLAGDQVLLARRAGTKRHDPGLWAPAVAGTVASGDDYEDTAVRETFEELGLVVSADQLVRVGKVVADQGGAMRVATSYVYRTDAAVIDGTWDRDEIGALAWFDRDKLAGLIHAHPEMFVGGTNRAWQSLLAS